MGPIIRTARFDVREGASRGYRLAASLFVAALWANSSASVSVISSAFTEHASQNDSVMGSLPVSYQNVANTGGNFTSPYTQNTGPNNDQMANSVELVGFESISSTFIDTSFFYSGAAYGTLGRFFGDFPFAYVDGSYDIKFSVDTTSPGDPFRFELERSV